MTLTTAPHAPAAPGIAANRWAVPRLLAADIKFSHTVFAMPFAILGAFMARPSDGTWAMFSGQLALVVVCMVAARTWAMVFNRLADRTIDSLNPRTARRVFASGLVQIRLGRITLAVCAAVFIAAAAGFWFAFGNPWPIALAVPVLAFLAFYSYTKRFTWLCHLFLGVALSLSPVAAALAIDHRAAMSMPALWWIAAMVAAWVAGFDIIYSLQDAQADKDQRLWSVPSRLGIRPALWISRALHAAALFFLLAAGRADERLGPLFLFATLAVGVLLVAEHVVLSRRGREGLHMAFFTINGIVSCLLGIVGCTDVSL